MTEQTVSLRLAVLSLALSTAGVAGAAEMLKDAAAPTTYPTTSPAVSDSVRPWASGVRIAPVLANDAECHTRVMFKIACSNTGEVRTKTASDREGLIVYDITQKKYIGQYDMWGHPSWYRDSRTIVQYGNQLIDTDTRRAKPIPDLPHFPGAGHPSAGTDGKLMVLDAFDMTRFGGTYEDCGVVVCDLAGGSYVMIDQFNGSGGAASWRRSHPHPVFSADGRRIYYNIARGKWTRLFVAELGGAVGASAASN